MEAERFVKTETLNSGDVALWRGRPNPSDLTTVAACPKLGVLPSEIMPAPLRSCPGTTGLQPGAEPLLPSGVSESSLAVSLRMGAAPTSSESCHQGWRFLSQGSVTSEGLESHPGLEGQASEPGRLLVGKRLLEHGVLIPSRLPRPASSPTKHNPKAT